MTNHGQKIIVFGKNGQVGQELQRAILSGKNNHTYDECLFLGRDDIDLTNPEALSTRLLQESPAAIINAAAYTAVDKAETEPEIAMAVNAKAPEIMALYAQEQKIPFIHISTDYVFNGTKTSSYTENDPIAPINIYGKSKAEGETAIMATHAPAVILRTSWVYAQKGNNFIHTMLRLGQERETLNIVSDQIGAPTNAADIALAILHILPQIQHKQDSMIQPELYHMSANGYGSWHEFAQLIFNEAEKHGIKVPLNVGEIPSSAYPTPATRPLNSRLDCTLIEKEYGVSLPHWKDSAIKCITTILENQNQEKVISA